MNKLKMQQVIVEESRQLLKNKFETIKIEKRSKKERERKIEKSISGNKVKSSTDDERISTSNKIKNRDIIKSGALSENEAKVATRNKTSDFLNTISNDLPYSGKPNGMKKKTKRSQSIPHGTIAKIYSRKNNNSVAAVVMGIRDHNNTSIPAQRSISEKQLASWDIRISRSTESLIFQNSNENENQDREESQMTSSLEHKLMAKKRRTVSNDKKSNNKLDDHSNNLLFTISPETNKFYVQSGKILAILNWIIERSMDDTDRDAYFICYRKFTTPNAILAFFINKIKITGMIEFAKVIIDLLLHFVDNFPDDFEKDEVKAGVNQLFSIELVHSNFIDQIQHINSQLMVSLLFLSPPSSSFFSCLLLFSLHSSSLPLPLPLTSLTHLISPLPSLSLLPFPSLFLFCIFIFIQYPTPKIARNLLNEK